MPKENSIFISQFIYPFLGTIISLSHFNWMGIIQLMMFLAKYVYDCIEDYESFQKNDHTEKKQIIQFFVFQLVFYYNM